MDRLQKLVFSFYREDFLIQQKLKPLLNARMIRSRKSIVVECLDKNHYSALSFLIRYLVPPIAELNLGSEIVLSAPGPLKQHFRIHKSFNGAFVLIK